MSYAKSPIAVLAAMLLVLGAAHRARAYADFVDAIPNGSAFGCLTCHAAMPAGEGWNDFGKDMLEAGGANPYANLEDQNLGYSPPGEPQRWSELCDYDSDGDGYSNGEELGDPSCVWLVGDDDPLANVTNPGDGDDFPGGGGGGLCSASSVGHGAPGALALVGLLGGLLARAGRRVRAVHR